MIMANDAMVDAPLPLAPGSPSQQPDQQRKPWSWVSGLDLSPRVSKILAALWYCTYFAGLAAITPYYTVFYKSRGLTDSQIGIVALTRQLVSVPGSLFWSSIADHFNAHRLVLLAVLLLSTVSRVFIYKGASFVVFVVLILINQFFTAPVTVLSDTIVMSSAKQDGDYGKVRAWGAVGWGGFSAVSGTIIDKWGYLAGFITSAVLTAPCAPATTVFKFKDKTTAALEALKEAEEAEAAAIADADCTIHSVTGSKTEKHHMTAVAAASKNGHADVHSSSRSIISSPLSEYWTVADAAQFATVAGEQEGAASGNKGAGTCCSHPLSTAGSSSTCRDVSTVEGISIPPVLVSKQKAEELRIRRAAEAEELQAIAKLSHIARLRLLLSDIEVWLLLWNAILQGFGLGLYQTYLFLTLESMGGSRMLMGLTITVDALGEAPSFFCQSIALRYVSVDFLLNFAVITYSVRLALYALLPFWRNPWLVLPIQLLHGMSYAFGWGAATIKGRMLSKPGLQATTQSLMQQCYIGLGAGLGSAIGGFLITRYGQQWMWGICSITMAGGFLLHCAVRSVVQLRRAALARAHGACST